MRSRALLLFVVVAMLSAGCALPTGPVAPAVTYPGEVLGGAPWTTLVLEIDHAPGRAPSEMATTHLLSTLKNITSKTEVRLRIEETLPAGARTWTSEELVALEKETRSTQHAAPTAVVHILYPAGTFNRTGVAGVTIGGVILGPVVVFLDTLRDIQLGAGLPAIPQPQVGVDTLERATLLHEAGHGFGLVNNGLEMVRAHEDRQNAGHSPNTNSVMYYKVDQENGLREYLLADGSVPSTFDADDMADIRRAGGR